MALPDGVMIRFKVLAYAGNRGLNLAYNPRDCGSRDGNHDLPSLLELFIIIAFRGAFGVKGGCAVELRQAADIIDRLPKASLGVYEPVEVGVPLGGLIDASRT